MVLSWIFRPRLLKDHHHPRQPKLDRWGITENYQNHSRWIHLTADLHGCCVVLAYGCVFKCSDLLCPLFISQGEVNSLLPRKVQVRAQILDDTYQHQCWTRLSISQKQHNRCWNHSLTTNPLLDFPFALFYLFVLCECIHQLFTCLQSFLPDIFSCFCTHSRLWFSSLNLSPLFTAGIRRSPRFNRRHPKPKQWIQQRETSFGLTAETECFSSAPGRVLEDWINCAPIGWNVTFFCPNQQEKRLFTIPSGNVCDRHDV